MSRVVRRSSLMPVFSETAIQISGTSTPSRSRQTIDCFTALFSKDWARCLARAHHTLLEPIRMQCHVKVPASTSNLGSGFDTLGLAVKLYTTVQLERRKTDGIQLSETGVAHPGLAKLISEAGEHFFRSTREKSFGARVLL